MILIYAFGSGLGHLKRVTSFLHQKKYNIQECVLLTNSQYSEFWENKWTVIYKESSFFSSENFDNFLKNLILEKGINKIIVDVFPSGFYGELFRTLNNFEGEKILLARILADSYFIKNKKTPFYNTVYSFEKGIPQNKLSYEKLIKIGIDNNDSKINTQKINDKNPYFVIIHSQPISEVLFLYKLALMYRKKEKIFIFTAVKISDNDIKENTLVFESKVPDYSVLEKATKIFSAAGFNSFHQLIHFKNKWICTPFPRTFDDQFLRKELNESL